MGDENKIPAYLSDADLLWRASLDKSEAICAIDYIYSEGWLNEKIYRQCVEYIKQRDTGKDEANIAVLGFTTKIRRCLKSAKITTVGQLRYMLKGNAHPQSGIDFFDTRNIGAKSGIEIMQIAIETGVIKKEEIGVNHKKRNKAIWNTCRDFFGHGPRNTQT